MDSPLQTGDLHTKQRFVLVQSDQLSPLLRLQLHLQQLLLLVQELVQVAELGLDALLQVGGVLLSRWRAIVTGSSPFTFLKNNSGGTTTKMESMFHSFVLQKQIFIAQIRQITPSLQFVLVISGVIASVLQTYIHFILVKSDFKTLNGSNWTFMVVQEMQQ